MKKVHISDRCLTISIAHNSPLATWDTPPTDDAGRKLFLVAFEKYIVGRSVVVPVLTAKEAEKRDKRERKVFDVLQQPVLATQPSEAEALPGKLVVISPSILTAYQRTIVIFSLMD